jgi:hypothetical protein
MRKDPVHSEERRQQHSRYTILNSITSAALACSEPCFVAFKNSLIYCILGQPISRVYIPLRVPEWAELEFDKVEWRKLLQCIAR